jgi:hypothetical protein
MPKPLHEREPLDHNGECLYCDEPALTVADHAPRCPWRVAVEAALPLPADHPDARRSCCEPAPDRSGRTCDKPKGHDGDHWTYGGNTLTWKP